MTSSEISQTLQSLKASYSNTEDESSDINLGNCYDSCVKLQKLLENSNLPSNDELFQDAVSTCIKYLEKCTLMVNDLEMFSSNETAEEIQTASIKYLALPAMLGSLNISLQTKDLADRMKFINIAEVYFKDFILRCKNYEMCEKCLKYYVDGFENESREKIPTNPDAVRQQKIQLFKLKKELEEKEKVIKTALERSEEEEYVRDYYMALLEKWVLIAIEELENIKREKEILKSMPTKLHNSQMNNKENIKEVKPLKPIIITKNEIQKQVFGLGYPSIPVMTIDDFYYQRFHKQIKEQKAIASGISLQEKALKGEDLNNESEEVEKEKLLDRDDPVALMKARQWDDWKDDHPRGSGNRKNKG